ncbi:MAG: T9SS type A sorting domain-containing protein, partial [Flavobacterium sp.]
EPYATIYTGMTPHVVMTVSPPKLSEAIANDGSFSAGATILLATNNGTFTQSSGTMSLGTHYTISGVPSGLTPVLTVLNNTQIQLTFTGNATQHMSDDDATVVVTLLNPAITGGATVLESAVFSIALDFEDAYGIYYVNIPDITVDPNNVWESLQIEPNADDKYYGAFVDAASQNALKLETYQKPLICNGATKNITLLGNNEPVDATRNMVIGGAYPDLHVLRNASYTVWDGQSGYIGFKYYKNGNSCYGWFAVSVSADGSSYTLTDYAYNTQPNGTIYTPNVLGVDEMNQEEDIAVYPNPFESQFTIDTSKLLGENIEIAIVTILGQRIYEKSFNVSKQTISIDTHSFSKGLYVVQVIVNKDKVIKKKVIKK